jgi:hypothetical protein
LSEAATLPKMKTAYRRHLCVRLCDTCLFVATATDPDILPYSLEIASIFHRSSTPSTNLVARDHSALNPVVFWLDTLSVISAAASSKDAAVLSRKMVRLHAKKGPRLPVVDIVPSWWLTRLPMRHTHPRTRRFSWSSLRELVFRWLIGIVQWLELTSRLPGILR